MGRAETADARQIAECLGEAVPEGQPDILHRVVGVHVEIALRLHGERDPGVPGERVQHVGRKSRGRWRPGRPDLPDPGRGSPERWSRGVSRRRPAIRRTGSRRLIRPGPSGRPTPRASGERDRARAANPTAPPGKGGISSGVPTVTRSVRPSRGVAGRNRAPRSRGPAGAGASTGLSTAVRKRRKLASDGQTVIPPSAPMRGRQRLALGRDGGCEVEQRRALLHDYERRPAGEHPPPERAGCGPPDQSDRFGGAEQVAEPRAGHRHRLREGAEQDDIPELGEQRPTALRTELVIRLVTPAGNPERRRPAPGARSSGIRSPVGLCGEVGERRARAVPPGPGGRTREGRMRALLREPPGEAPRRRAGTAHGYIEKPGDG